MLTFIICQNYLGERLGSVGVTLTLYLGQVPFRRRETRDRNMKSNTRRWSRTFENDMLVLH